jgi:hypothetical protein
MALGKEHQAQRDHQSLGALFTDLTRETSDLVRKEVDLAKAELSEKVSQAGAGIALLFAGGLIAFAALLILLEAVIAILVEAGGLSPTVSALIVGVVVAIIAFILVQKGMSDLKAKNLTPRRTMGSLRRDKEFAKEQVK